EPRIMLPFVVAGLGKTTTDFTEIAAHPYYRLGGGISYHLTKSAGLRLEVRDEIITRLGQSDSPTGNLPSIRCGIVYRFYLPKIGPAGGGSCQYCSSRFGCEWARPRCP